MWTEEKGTAKFVLFPNELRGLFTVQLSLGNDRVVIEMNPKDMATFLNGLAPLKGIRDIYRWLREPEQRLRKPGGERRGDGSLCDNQNRMGPIHLAARLEALDRVLDIQRQVNEQADKLKRPRVDHINREEENRIRELIAANTWPNKWNGTEPRGDEPFEEWRSDGWRQPTLLTLDRLPVEKQGDKS